MSGAHVLYFHGFGSTPRSAKAAMLRASLASHCATYTVPELDGGDFRALTMDGIAARAEAAVRAVPADGAPVLVIGSSLGGYTAALLAAQRRLPRVAGLLLIAPAFGFTDRWRLLLGEAGIAAWRAQGTRLFFHHGVERELPVGIGFFDSCTGLPAIPGDPGLPVTIVHGRGDETVDWRFSRAYADVHAGVECHLVQGDHRLTEPRHESLITWCAVDLLARCS